MKRALSLPILIGLKRSLIGIILALSQCAVVNDMARATSSGTSVQMPAAKPCSNAVMDDLKGLPDALADRISLACQASLSSTDMVMKPLVFAGAAASGATLDCHGGTIGIPGHVEKGAPPTILITSTHDVTVEDSPWSVPHNITIRNCRIYGVIHIRGLGSNGEAEAVRLSSLSQGHTERAQAAAPSHITLNNITLIADGAIPLYLAPGVTNVTLTGSSISGKTSSTAIYMDAESAHNTIANVHFDIATGSRELIAVDGSAFNTIRANRFANPENGGIFLYRNCGEGGTIRHQTPHDNMISENTFIYHDIIRPRPAIWLGAREPWRMLYCYDDPPMPFGSGADNGNFADDNTVANNVIIGASSEIIRNSGERNKIRDNQFRP